MSDFEDIQNLIRLKRHEQPSPDFVDDFVHSFQQRQRAELLNNSARGLLWERVTTYFDGLLAPKWAMAGAAAVAMLGTAIVLRPANQGGSAFASNGGASACGYLHCPDLGRGSAPVPPFPPLPGWIRR